jgi:hypothetical protein
VAEDQSAGRRRFIPGLMNNISNRQARSASSSPPVRGRASCRDPLRHRDSRSGPERGYHAMMPNTSITHEGPMSIKKRGFG